MSDESEWTVSAEALRKDQDPHVLMRQNVTSVPNLVRFVARAQFPQRPVADFRIEKRLPAPPGTTTRLSILGLTGDTLMHLFIDLVTAVVQGQLAFPLECVGFNACRRTAFYHVEVTFAGYDVDVVEELITKAHQFCEEEKGSRSALAALNVAVEVSAFPKPQAQQWRTLSAKNTVDSATTLIGRRK